jgi:hypothetical protein
VAQLTSVQSVTAQTQTSSNGWFYADAEPGTITNRWDGRLWPEITGYSGHVVDAQTEQPQVEQPLFAQPRVGSALADLPPLFEVVALAQGSASETATELPEAEPEERAEPIEAEFETKNRGVARLVLLVALILLVVVLIAGVAL